MSLVTSVLIEVMVSLIVITLSHPAALGIVSLYAPEVVHILPLGDVYDGLHVFIELVLAVLDRIVRSVIITLSHPAALGIVSLYTPELVHNLPLGDVYKSHDDVVTDDVVSIQEVPLNSTK